MATKTRQKRDAKVKGAETERTTGALREEVSAGDASEGVDGGGARSLGERLKRLDWRLVGLILGVKLLLFVYGVHVYYLLSDQRLPTYYGWLEIWNRWDAPHYLDLAREGYVSTGEHRLWLVFYPLYPWLVRVVAFFTGGDYFIGALVVSAVASVAAGLLLHRLALLDEDDRVARASVWFLLIFPTSYFLHIGYTESLFIALTVGCFLAARRGVWWAAALLAALAGLTRVNGLLLIPALAVEAFEQWRATRRFQREWLWMLVAPVGFGLYLLLNKYVTGDAFAFQTIAREHWWKTLAWPWKGIWEVAVSMWWRQAAEAQTVGVAEFVFLMLGLGCTVWCWLRLRASYGVWMTANWLLWTSTSFILSSPRYTLILFPIYMLFARLAVARPVWGGVITVWSLLLLAMYVSQFVQGRWAF